MLEPSDGATVTAGQCVEWTRLTLFLLGHGTRGLLPVSESRRGGSQQASRAVLPSEPGTCHSGVNYPA